MAPNTGVFPNKWYTIFSHPGSDPNGEVKANSQNRHQLGPRAVGKSTLYFESIEAQDIDFYQVNYGLDEGSI